MFTFLVCVTFFCIVLILHTYLVYPFTTIYLAKSKPEWWQTYTNDNELPPIAIVMAAFNEENVLAQKMESLLQTNYPNNKISIWIGNDNSTDQTQSILEYYKKNTTIPCHIINFTQRTGKPKILNHLVEQIKKTAPANTIAVFTDANVFLTPLTLPELVKPFAQQNIGLTGANVVFTNIDSHNQSQTENIFNNTEINLKYAEGKLWGTMAGAFGALFAFRLNLFSPFPNGIMVDDLYVSLAIFKQKFKQVLIKSALAYEDVNGDSQIEFNRKVRIAIGSWQNMDYHADALMPPNNKLAYTFISHKLLRWLTPHALIILYPTLLFLGLRNNLFLILFLLFQASIILALIHVALKIFQIKLPILPSIAHFYHMNIALLLGFFKFLIGTKDQNTWTPTKRKTQN